ncbi:MAG: YlxM family DNA-binding protein [Ruminococcus sp.]|nr:YlxM family DNA-binding protein [Ruminococcus sp.]
MEKNLEISLLFDFYKEMLTPTQQEAISLYYNDDLSLGEVADILSISRQGVRDALTRAKKSLYNFEEKLSLCERFSKTQNGLESIISLADTLCGYDDEAVKKLSLKIKTTALKLYEQEV